MKGLRKIKTRFEAVYEFREEMGEYFVKTPKMAESIARTYMEMNTEEMWAFYMNIKNRLIHAKLIVKGGYNTIMCTPADIIIPALQINSRNVVLAHNHPSNDCTPSTEDTIFTKKVERAFNTVGLSLLDHIILSRDDHYSYKGNGVI